MFNRFFFSVLIFFTSNVGFSMSKMWWVHECEHATGETKKTFDALDEHLFIWPFRGCASKYDALMKIRSLDIDDDKELTDLGPLSGLTNLEELSIYGHLISDLSPLSSLKKLQKLHIWNTSRTNYEENRISDLRPLSGLKKLNSLKLEGSINMSDLEPLAELTNLNKLEIKGCTVSDLVPLAELVNLREIVIKSKNPISDLRPLSGLKKIRELSIGDSLISDLTPLSGLTKLQKIRIHNVESLLSDLNPLSRLTNLKEVHLGRNQISDLSPLARLSNLEVIWLAYNHISDLNPLSGLRNVNRLCVSENYISDFSPVSHIRNVEGIERQILESQEDEHRPYEEPTTNEDITRNTPYKKVKELVSKKVSLDKSHLYPFVISGARLVVCCILRKTADFAEPHAGEFASELKNASNGPLSSAGIDLLKSIPVMYENNYGLLGVFFPKKKFNLSKELKTAYQIYEITHRFSLLNDEISEKITINLKRLLEIKNSSEEEISHQNLQDAVKLLRQLDLLFQVTTKKVCIVNSDDLQRQIQALTQYNSQTVKDGISEIVEIMHELSQIGPSSHKKRCFFFLGKHGIGKTYLSRKLADILPIPILELDAGDFDLTQLSDPLKMESNLGNKIISLTSKDHRNGTNILILIDEADRFYNDENINKVLFEKLVNNIPLLTDLAGITISLKISEAIIIMTGNNRLPGDFGDIQEIAFEDYTKEQKYQIGLHKLQEQSSSNGLDIDEEDLEEIEDFIKHYNRIGIRGIENKVKEMIISKKTSWDEDE